MSDPKPVIVSDGNETLVTIDRVKRFMSDNPAHFPKLTAAHLMGAPLVGQKEAKAEIDLDDLMSRNLRAWAVGTVLFKSFVDRDQHILMHEVHLLQRDGFVQLMKMVERQDSIARGLSRRDYEYAWEVYDKLVRQMAAKGREWRKRNAHISG